MKCDLCGTQSEFDAAFTKQRRSFSLQTRNICPTCWAKQNSSRNLRFLFAIPVLGMCGYVLGRLTPGSFFGDFLLDLSIVGVFMVLTIIPHELGHALAARALGWRVYQITIGVGNTIWKRRWNGTLVDVRSLPIAGATFMVPEDTRWFRLKFFLAIFAGPAVNAVLAWVAIVLWQDSPPHLDLDALPRAARLFVWANVAVLVVNLWPHKPRAAFGIATDGSQLLQLASFKRSTLHEIQAMRFACEANNCRTQCDFAGARSWCDKGLALYPEDSQMLNLSAVNYLDEEKYEQARAVLLKLLGQRKHPSAMHFMLLNNLAYADAISENPAWLAEADAYSRDAYTMLPWSSAVTGTRGTVLVALGHYQEGIELLKKSMEDADTPRNKAENACYVAVALVKSGKQTEAVKYLQLARELDFHGPILQRAQRSLQHHGACS